MIYFVKGSQGQKVMVMVTIYLLCSRRTTLLEKCSICWWNLASNQLMKWLKRWLNSVWFFKVAWLILLSFKTPSVGWFIDPASPGGRKAGGKTRGDSKIIKWGMDEVTLRSIPECMWKPGLREFEWFWGEFEWVRVILRILTFWKHGSWKTWLREIKRIWLILSDFWIQERV